MESVLRYDARMPVAPRSTQSDRPRRLLESELREARAVAERLAVEVMRLLDSVEPQYRNAFALARFLQIDRTGIQRLLSAVTVVDERTLAQAPGPKALRRILVAYTQCKGDPAVIQGFQEAIRQFEKFLGSCGGHQRGYNERLVLTQQPAEVQARSENTAATELGSENEARRRVFDAARALTGRWSDVRTQITIIRPSETVPRARDVVRARGLIGHMQQADAVALVFAYLFNPTDAARSRYNSLRPRPGEDVPNFLLEEFCSTGWSVTSMIEGGTLLQHLQPDPPSLTGPADLVTASTSFGAAPDPRYQEPPFEEIWAEVEFPVRRSILDIYLHVDLARRCAHGADAHALRIADPSFVQQIHRRWMTGIGPPLTLSLLGTGLSAADSDAYARQRPLTETLFSAVGWDPERFVGFRLDTDFPLWRTSLRAYFDFEALSGRVSGEDPP